MAVFLASYSSYGGSSELLKTDSELKYRGKCPSADYATSGGRKEALLGVNRDQSLADFSGPKHWSRDSCAAGDESASRWHAP